MLGESARQEDKKETIVERADWLESGLSSSQARYLMVRAITRHLSSSTAWGEREKRRLFDELMGIDDAATRMFNTRGDFRD
jgi:hypothetical protein